MTASMAWAPGSAGFGAALHEAAELALGAHLAGEHGDGVLEERGFEERRAGLFGFEGH